MAFAPPVWVDVAELEEPVEEPEPLPLAPLAVDELDSDDLVTVDFEVVRPLEPLPEA